MNLNTQKLHRQGVSILLDNITRNMLDNGVLQHYIDELSITGLTSNPSIFEAAIAKTSYYDEAIKKISGQNLSDEDLFFSLAIEDIQRAADFFLPVYLGICLINKKPVKPFLGITQGAIFEIQNKFPAFHAILFFKRLKPSRIILRFCGKNFLFQRNT